MKKREKAGMVLCLFFLLASGCGGPPEPTESQRNWAERERERIKRFMHSISSSIRDRDHEIIMRRYVYAGTTAERRYANYAGFKRATWIPELDGYRYINLNDALRKLHWEDLTWEQRVEFRVRSTCSEGKVWDDYFELIRPEGDWMVTAARLRAPETGSVIVMGRGDKENITELAMPLLEEFREMNITAIYDMLPNTYEARYRERSPGRLGRLLMQDARPVHIMDDLKRLKKLHTEHWPDAEEGFPARYESGMSVSLSYSIPISNPDGENSEPELIELAVYVSENEDREWELRKIRLHGPGITD